MSNHLKGLSSSKLYRKHHSMLERCYNKKHKSFPDYGGRGITVCDEWKNSFLVFYDWAMDQGYTEGLTIDRILVDEALYVLREVLNVDIDTVTLTEYERRY